jgi:CheY-like chemotaxis protein
VRATAQVVPARSLVVMVVSEAQHPRSKVLVVDSDDSRRRSVARMLTQHRCEVHTARGLGAARHLLAAGAFDVVFAQMRLEDASGLNVLTEVRALDQRVPVVLWFEPPQVMNLRLRPSMLGSGRPVALWFLRHSVEPELFSVIDDGYRKLAERAARRLERQRTIPIHPL